MDVVKKACLKPGSGSRSRLQYLCWAERRQWRQEIFSEQRTSFELLFLFVRVFGLENALLPRNSKPGKGKAEETEAELEGDPGQVRQLTAGLLRRAIRRRRHRQWSWSCKLGCEGEFRSGQSRGGVGRSRAASRHSWVENGLHRDSHGGQVVAWLHGGLTSADARYRRDVPLRLLLDGVACQRSHSAVMVGMTWLAIAPV